MKFQNYPDVKDDKFFLTMKPEWEYLQPVPKDAHYAWTETSMFGFNIPEHDIDCIVYYWHHPAMGITTGGLMIWRGKNTNQVECEYSDYRTAMPLPKDHTNCTYANGVSVKMIEPLKRFHIAFSDKERNTHLDLHLSAIMPPACRHNGGHITQAMKTNGELVLNGEKFTIDGFHSRDRSWNEARDESLLKLPAINWTVGIVDENFAFHHLTFDHLKHHPEWKGKLIELDKHCQWGYVWEDGKLHGVIDCDQRSEVYPGTLMPTRVESTLSATNGKKYRITGTAGATVQIQAWPNMAAHFALFRWDVDGRGVAYGDLQRCIWRDAWRTMIGKN
jgi:hypothetical protein